MITEQQIKKLAIEWVYSQETHARSTDPEKAFIAGFQAATEQMQAEIQEGAQLISRWAKAYEAEKAENTRLYAAIRSAIQQIEEEDMKYAALGILKKAIVSVAGEVDSMQAENEKLQAENERLRDALQDLYDEQNDAPLESRRAQWQGAMDNAKNALK